jgi:O-antigen ligase
MRKFFSRLDEIAEVNHENRLGAWLERTAFIFLVLMVLSAPHSIAATQIAWGLGMLAWLVRLFIKPRPKLVRTPLDLALWAFFLWSALTAVFSYAPDISLNSLRNVAIFLIFYFVINVTRTRRAAVFLALALVASCMFNVLLVPVDRLIGRGVEIHGIRPDSPLAKALLYEGDTLLKANRKKIRTPEDLTAEIEKSDAPVKVEFYRPDFYFAVEVKRENLLAGGAGAGATALEKLGIESWKKSRNWRSMGFFGHWTTYAEVLQLIASLVFGLLVALIGGKRFFTTETQRHREKLEQDKPDKKKFPRLLFSLSPLLLFCLAAMMFALLLTATRASQAGFLISAFAIVLINGNRKMLLALAALALPLAIGGAVYLQQSRNVGFVDEKDDSTRYRQIVYREGFDLWTKNARNFFLGVGMDSVKRYAVEWRLYDDGRLPMGHFHSTPLQLLVERGLPALLLWLWIVWIYARRLIGGISDFKFQIPDFKFQIPDSRFQIPDSERENSALRTPHSALERGVLLGSFGGLIGFFAGGLVHYNLGDQEVAMIFFLLMGISIKIVQGSKFKVQSLN